MSVASPQPETSSSLTSYSVGAKAKAWAVHAFTISGVVWAMLAVFSLHVGNYRAMWGWLTVALIVDGLDGTMARKNNVSQVVPWFDGAILDHVIDYLTWTFIPAAFIALVIPVGGGGYQIFFGAVVCVSSVFCYCNTQMKSEDYYFVGFPAAWNLVAVCLWIFDLPAWVNIALIVTFAILTLVPTTYLHPFRVKELMVPNIVAAALWVFATGWLVVVSPDMPLLIMVIWWASGLWLAGVSLMRTIRGRREAAAHS